MLCCRAPLAIETTQVIAQESQGSALGPSTSAAADEVSLRMAACECAEVRSSPHRVL
jgi:hypothetical protein